ncbi:MAG: hypothetical protein JKY94_10940 [Rhodobacteraceae bacterium]|nr:hypothetical protein [Paracoccaceae bacterium]
MNGYDSTLDPKGLIHESFQIEGITASECRSIFLDWALSLPSTEDTNAALKILLDRYAKDTPDHPMSIVIQQGLTTITTPKRRGGWRSRTRN